MPWSDEKIEIFQKSVKLYKNALYPVGLVLWYALFYTDQAVYFSLVNTALNMEKNPENLTRFREELIKCATQKTS